MSKKIYPKLCDIVNNGYPQNIRGDIFLIVKKYLPDAYYYEVTDFYAGVSSYKDQEFLKDFIHKLTEIPSNHVGTVYNKTKEYNYYLVGDVIYEITDNMVKVIRQVVLERKLMCYELKKIIK